MSGENDDPWVDAFDPAMDEEEPAFELFRPFEYFDPVADPVPEDWPHLYAELVERARALIPVWDRTQVERVADLWHFLLQQLHMAGFKEAEKQAEAQGQVTTYRASPSTVNEVAQRWGDMKVDDLIYWPETDTLPSWSQLYAGLALTRVAMRFYAIRMKGPGYGIPQLLVELGLERDPVTHAARTLEAIAYAEQEWRAKTARKRVALRGARARHAKTNQLRLKVARWHDDLKTETPEITAVKAAEIIEATYREEITATLKKNQDPAEQIEQWIGEYRREPDKFMARAQASTTPQS